LASKPWFFENFYAVLEDRAVRVGTAALAVTPSLALYTPLSHFRAEFSKVPRILRAMGFASLDLRFAIHFDDGEAQERPSKRLKDLVLELVHLVHQLKKDLEATDEQIQILWTVELDRRS
jgi:hypothetical protein